MVLPTTSFRSYRSVRRLLRAAAAACLLFLVAVTVSCGGKSGDPQAVVLVVIDTLRADHLGCMGYPTAYTPHLDALAREGVLFTDAMTPVPVTLPSVTSLLTGQLPIDHGVRDNEGFVLPEQEVTLAERFRQAGWRTAAVVASAVLAADRGLAQGFETYDDRFQGPYPVYDPSLESFADEMARTRRRADTVTDLAIGQVRRLAGERFFLLVHYFDVHSHYDPPPHTRRLHASTYDGEVSFVDEQIGRLLDALDQERTLVVVVSDHGEGLGEHGEPEHGFLLYQSTLHVVTIARGPGIPAGLRRNDPVSLVDIEPTLAAAAGLAAGELPRDGRVLQWGHPQAQARTLYAETFRTLTAYGWSELRAARRGNLKRIEGAGRVEVYDLLADPLERHDLGATEEAPALGEWLAQRVRDDDPEDVLSRSRHAPDPKRRELLEALGYLGGAATRGEGRSRRPHPLDALPAWLEHQEDKLRLRKAAAWIRAKKTAEAKALLDTVIAHGKEAVRAHYFRAMALEREGDAAAAAADLLRSESLDPGFAPTQMALARGEMMSGQRQAALRRLERLLTLDPDNVVALREVVNPLLRQGDVEAALPYLRRLAAAQPDDPDSQYNLGLAELKLGHREAAARALRRFLELAPSSDRVDNVRQLLAEAGL